MGARRSRSQSKPPAVGSIECVFIDGYQVYDINDVRPYDVRAIEVYTDRNAAPQQYRVASLKDMGQRDSHCPVVLVWTKPREPRGKQKVKQ